MDKKKLLLYLVLGLVIVLLLLLTLFPGMIYALNDSGVLGNSVGNSVSDKCTPALGYSVDSWKEHMSHHPDIYEGCL
ncbi:hypothetical protein COU61_01850 [Candidatus Pacearchaeota archaeon CG10_big_fil_rev_8_21_14_0_10_35_13]|nr:MAG: hypothetical protein COU61_01850 [Candidatus Pacearchaeota archaeon CG10_big_fil_rev_8_21_14_0_10_35_13]